MGGSYSRAKYDKTSYWRDYFADDMPKDAATGKTVAVTGATANGLGIWLAKHAALLGAKRVVLLNRASPRSAAAEEEVRAFAKEHGSASEIHTVECDLLSFASVKRCAAELKKLCAKHDDGCLDVLCLNAGTMAAPDEVTEDGYNREAQVNVLAQALLLKETFPLLERAAERNGEARVAQHSSGARMIPAKGELVRAFFANTSASEPLPKPFAGDSPGMSGMFSVGPAWQRYGQTKLANAMLSELFREKLAGKASGVKSLVASPGLAATELQVTTKERAAGRTRPPLTQQSQASQPGSKLATMSDSMARAMAAANAAAKTHTRRRLTAEERDRAWSLEEGIRGAQGAV